MPCHVNRFLGMVHNLAKLFIILREHLNPTILLFHGSLREKGLATRQQSNTNVLATTYQHRFCCQGSDCSGWGTHTYV